LNRLCVFYQGEDKNSYGKQRLWGSVGWSLNAIISGTCVDWYSAGLEYKNYTPAYVIALICFLLDTCVVFNIKVKYIISTNVMLAMGAHLTLKLPPVKFFQKGYSRFQKYRSLE